MNIELRENLRQRADYTHKPNIKTGRHGWLRLTPAYSVKIVEELVGSATNPLRVLDPFCGTATTGLSAAYHGHTAVTTEINPFLVWLGRAKTKHYTTTTVTESLTLSKLALNLVNGQKSQAVPEPPIHNIERWWSPKARGFLCSLLGAIGTVSEAESAERTLLNVAFCRTLIKLSNASFNHQSMSFKDTTQTELEFAYDPATIFEDDIRFVLGGAGENFEGSCEVVQGDARTLQRYTNGDFNLVVTSPPYVNRMSYIRELRPYMYWLGYLASGREAGELDWSCIGGTWGLATSRLVDWKLRADTFQSEQLLDALASIAHERNANGQLLANYVSKYFEDMHEHFFHLREVLASGARIHYIVGNSTFYGSLVHVEKIYAEIMKRLGYASINIRAIRKRNSKKELLEFDVSAIWPG